MIFIEMKSLNYLLITAICALSALCTCCNEKTARDKEYVTPEQEVHGLCKISERDGLIIYTPEYNFIYLAPGPNVPEFFPERSFCCAAAYTEKGTNIVDLIMGHYIKEGKLCNNNPTEYETGYFMYDGDFKFLNKVDSLELKKVAEMDGMVFGQDMMIYDNFIIRTQRQKAGKDIETKYRALCSVNDTLKIIESKVPIKLQEFQELLLKNGVNYAIYLDMGTYNYGWYQDKDGFHELNKENYSENKYSNFLVFGV